MWLAQGWDLGAWLALVAGGIGCGFVNTLAGGGSLITMPLLIILGLDPLVANATNRMALTIQYAVAVWGFRQEGVETAEQLSGLAWAGLAGCVFGTILALKIDPRLFQTVLGVIMLIALIPIAMHGKSWFQKEAPPRGEQRTGWLLLTCFGIGFYSGFIQVGIGVWSLIALLGLGGYALQTANATKALLLTIFALFSTILFAWSQQILWGVGAVLALGNAVGARFATWLSARSSLGWVRWLLIIGVAAASAKMLGWL